MPTSVSVIIPTYNRSVRLRRALASVAAQTRLPREVIVCDDGSEEDIRAVVDEFESRLNTSYIRITKSGGPGRPRNIGFAAATGSWISFLDSDDWWVPNRIETLQPFLRQPIDLVYHCLSVEYSTTPPFWRRLRVIGYDCGSNPLLTMIIRGNPIPNSAATVRRASLAALGGITENFSLFEDFDTWLRLAEAGGIFKFVDLSLGVYSVNGGNMSTFSMKQFHRQKALFEQHLPLLPDPLKPVASSHFTYLLGSYAARLRLLPLAEQYLSQVRPSKAFPRWIRATMKRVAIRTPFIHLLPR